MNLPALSLREWLPFGGRRTQSDQHRTLFELLTYSALALSDENKREVCASDVVECVRTTLDAGLSRTEVAELRKVLHTHPSFKAIAGGKYLIA
jgi:hypothetical protein